MMNISGDVSPLVAPCATSVIAGTLKNGADAQAKDASQQHQCKSLRPSVRPHRWADTGGRRKVYVITAMTVGATISLKIVAEQPFKLFQPTRPICGFPEVIRVINRKMTFGPLRGNLPAAGPQADKSPYRRHLGRQVSRAPSDFC